MEQDTLKSAWHGLHTGIKGNAELKVMIQERSHPTLKRIRKQMILEIVAFTIFLLVYYDFFDGDTKPLYANIIIIAGLVTAIMQNIVGYIFTRRHAKGDNLKQSLGDNLIAIRRYAVATIASRVLLAVCFLLFFSSVIVFTPGRYWMLAGMILVFIFQIVLLIRIWRARIRRLRVIIDSF